MSTPTPKGAMTLGVSGLLEHAVALTFKFVGHHYKWDSALVESASDVAGITVGIISLAVGLYSIWKDKNAAAAIKAKRQANAAKRKARAQAKRQSQISKRSGP